VLVFTGGIGENSETIRAGVCENLEAFGVQLDEEANRHASGECRISKPAGGAQIWIVPTNEELIVARQARQLLEG
jgi:acetate kinase